jgi:hypothetical protein
MAIGNALNSVRDVQIFTTIGTTTWTKPTGAKFVYVICIGAGGGGGGGAAGTVSTLNTGGCGGGGGSVVSKFITASDLPASVPVVVGSGGTGGVGTSAALGNNGNQGSNSSFGSGTTIYSIA